MRRDKRTLKQSSLFPFIFLPEAAEAAEGTPDERFLCSPEQLPGDAAEGGWEREGVSGQSSSRIQSHGEQIPGLYIEYNGLDLTASNVILPNTQWWLELLLLNMNAWLISDAGWCWWNLFVSVSREMEWMWMTSWWHLKSKCFFLYFTLTHNLCRPFCSLFSLFI